MSATQDQISWVLTSYIVAAAIFTPLTGVLADRLGRKRLFAIAVIGFTVASMLCGAATSLTQLVLFRAAARRARREPRAAVASRAARHLSAREARLRDGAVGHGRDGRPDLGPDARRLLDRVLQLALGVLHQPARRHAGADRRHRVRAGGHERAEARLRLLRLRAAVDRDRRAAAHARPRQRARLVRLDRGRARSRDRGARVLSVHGPHVHGRQAVHRAGLVRRPQFRGRRHADVHGRRVVARDDGAAAAVPPKLARLPRDHGRLRARAARHRHDGRHDGRRPARRQSRHALAGARRDSR